jgi:hypothetical protein
MDCNVAPLAITVDQRVLVPSPFIRTNTATPNHFLHFVFLRRHEQKATGECPTRSGSIIIIINKLVQLTLFLTFCPPLPPTIIIILIINQSYLCTLSARGPVNLSLSLLSRPQLNNNEWTNPFLRTLAPILSFSALLLCTLDFRC